MKGIKSVAENLPQKKTPGLSDFICEFKEDITSIFYKLFHGIEKADKSPILFLLQAELMLKLDKEYKKGKLVHFHSGAWRQISCTDY